MLPERDGDRIAQVGRALDTGAASRVAPGQVARRDAPERLLRRQGERVFLRRVVIDRVVWQRVDSAESESTFTNLHPTAP